MKKFVLLCLTILLCQTCEAIEFYPYELHAPQILEGTYKTKGCDDVIILKEKDSSLTKDYQNLTTANRVLRRIIFDPYIIPVNGNNYVMVKDRTDSKWSKDDLVGINDPKDNRFYSLIKLNSDTDSSKITSEELKKANVRLVRLDKTGKLLVSDKTKDFDLNKIEYIDIINLKRTANSEKTGIFGHFNVYIKTGKNKVKMVVGYITFDTNKNLEVLFK